MLGSADLIAFVPTRDPEKARTMIRFVHEHSERIRSGAGA